MVWSADAKGLSALAAIVMVISAVITIPLTAVVVSYGSDDEEEPRRQVAMIEAAQAKTLYRLGVDRLEIRKAVVNEPRELYSMELHGNGGAIRYRGYYPDTARLTVHVVSEDAVEVDYSDASPNDIPGNRLELISRYFLAKASDVALHASKFEGRVLGTTASGATTTEH